MEFLGMLDIMQGVVHKKRRNYYGHFLCPPPTVLCIAVKEMVFYRTGHEIDSKLTFMTSLCQSMTGKIFVLKS